MPYMALLPIVTGADTPVLRTKTTVVPKVTKEVLKLIKNMQQTVKHAKGAGLAAPQVDLSVRVCLALINGKMIPLINPTITKKSAEKDSIVEACLSLPGIDVPVERPVQISIQYLDDKGQSQERTLKGFDARVVQHEVDHLEGILIVDYFTQLDGTHEHTAPAM